MKKWLLQRDKSLSNGNHTKNTTNIKNGIKFKKGTQYKQHKVKYNMSTTKPNIVCSAQKPKLQKYRTQIVNKTEKYRFS